MDIIFETVKMKKSPIEQIPVRIKSYLLNWKYHNTDDYNKMFKDLRLSELTFENIHALFSYISTKDSSLLSKFN